jgi:uncharacterized membrane protein YccF (DUF307 family)
MGTQAEPRVVDSSRDGRFSSLKRWAGYGWFMTFGTFLPLGVFLSSYMVHVTLIGAPIAQQGYRLGIWLTTFGQEPPGDPKTSSEESGARRTIADRIRPYSPRGIVERHGRPFPLLVRGIWFILVGWWLGAVWVVLSWSILLAPYPFLDVLRALLQELPSTMTLAQPDAHPDRVMPKPIPPG